MKELSQNALRVATGLGNQEFPVGSISEASMFRFQSLSSNQVWASDRQESSMQILLVHFSCFALVGKLCIAKLRAKEQFWRLLAQR